MEESKMNNWIRLIALIGVVVATGSAGAFILNWLGEMK